MNPLLTSIVLATFFGIIPLRDLADDQLTLQVNASGAQIKPHAPGLRAGYGQSVTFSLRADFRCGRDAVAESIVISISDTHYRHVPAAGERSFLATVVVPGEQIAPAETGEFCSGEDSGRGEVLLLPAAATAQVSLRCRADAASSISFASTPLPLRLVCQGENGQDASASAGSLAR